MGRHAHLCSHITSLSPPSSSHHQPVTVFIKPNADSRLVLLAEKRRAREEGKRMRGREGRVCLRDRKGVVHVFEKKEERSEEECGDLLYPFVSVCLCACVCVVECLCW